MLKKHLLITLFFSMLIGQVSVSDINRLSNKQLDALKEQLSESSQELEGSEILKQESLDKVEISVEKLPKSKAKIFILVTNTFIAM